MSSNVQNPNPFISESVFWSEDPEQFRIQFVRYWNDISRGTNQREIAAYNLSEITTGQQWFDPANTQNSRDGFRTTFNIGAIAPGVTLTTAHGISQVNSFTYIGGTVVTALPDFRPVPYASTTVVTDQIQIRADAVNFYVTNGATAPAIVSGNIVLEYLKS